MATRASRGAVLGPEAGEAAARSEVEPRRSPADEVDDCVDWICDAVYRPRAAMGSSLRRVSAVVSRLEWRGGSGDGGGAGHGGGRAGRGVPGPRHGLHDDVVLLDAGLEQLLAAAGEQALDDLRVPARVHDADAQVGAVVVLGFAGAFDCGGHDGGGCGCGVFFGRVDVLSLCLKLALVCVSRAGDGVACDVYVRLS